MKLYIFGSCSGTEPFPDRHHTAWALEVNGRLYWFDAGEGCTHTAHLMGVDLHTVSDIFISHTHMDHVGGLPHLLWTIRKLYFVRNTLPKFGDVSVYIPNAESFSGVMAMLRNAEGGYECPYQTLSHKVADGVLLQTADVTVTARHNLHLEPTREGYQSFSFLIEALDKRIVYTGDIKSFDEIDGLLAAGCDVLLVETGHHDPVEICRLMKDRGIGHMYFLHHGRAIMHNFDGLLTQCRAVMPNVTFCNDKDVFQV